MMIGAAVMPADTNSLRTTLRLIVQVRIRWTQGPDVAAYKDEAAAVGAAGDDAETLRERQRLAQVEMMDRWIGGVLTEQRRTRRWKLFFRFMTLFLVLALVATVVYNAFWAATGDASTLQRHLGIVALMVLLPVMLQRMPSVSFRD